MTELSYSEKLALKDAAGLFLIRGRDPEGNQQFAYLLVAGEKMGPLKDALAKGDCDVTQYGKVIEHGLGDPSEDIMQKMETDYGFDHSNILWVGEGE